VAVVDADPQGSALSWSRSRPLGAGFGILHIVFGFIIAARGLYPSTRAWRELWPPSPGNPQ